MAAGKEHASDFEKIIHEGPSAASSALQDLAKLLDPESNKSLFLARDRKKNEALAAKIFGRDRRSSTPQQKAPSLGGSLAGRVGVKKVCRRPPFSKSETSKLT